MNDQNMQRNRNYNSKEVSYRGTYTPLPIRVMNTLARETMPHYKKWLSLKVEDLLETAGRKTKPG